MGNITQVLSIASNRVLVTVHLSNIAEIPARVNACTICSNYGLRGSLPQAGSMECLPRVPWVCCHQNLTQIDTP